jgi:CubicO group peptidase (beta-lactamase class C family)
MEASTQRNLDANELNREATIRTRLDAVLRSAVAGDQLVGVAATAWSESGLSYAGSAGTSGSTPMTPDTVVWVASMTKVVTAAAVMQLVERHELDLDQPAGDFVPYLANVQVLAGFETDGTAILRPPATPVTTRQLLAHTSGFGYDWAEASLARHVPSLPEPSSGSQANFEHPLTFDPGEQWSYGIGTDWAGRVIEAVTGERLDAYLAQHLLEPLQMVDTSFSVSMVDPARVATMHVRGPVGLTPIPFGLPADPEMFMAGGGLYSTAVDFLRFTRMLLAGGTLDGAHVLRPESVDQITSNQIGGLDATGWTSYNTGLTNDVALGSAGPAKWGLGLLINEDGTAAGRSRGSVGWAGLPNTYFWIDLHRAVTGVFVTQVLPFYDPVALAAYANFERAVYDDTP